MSDTWEVVVFDGATWFRGPVKYESRAEAEHAAERINVAPAYVRSTHELNLHGVTEGAPEQMRIVSRRQEA